MMKIKFQTVFFTQSIGVDERAKYLYTFINVFTVNCHILINPK